MQEKKYHPHDFTITTPSPPAVDEDALNARRGETLPTKVIPILMSSNTDALRRWAASMSPVVSMRSQEVRKEKADGVLVSYFIPVRLLKLIRTPLSSTIMSLPPLLPLLAVGLRSPSNISRHMFLISVTRWRVSRLSPL